jgi:Peptidase inhibitor I78 family
MTDSSRLRANYGSRNAAFAAIAMIIVIFPDAASAECDSRRARRFVGQPYSEPFREKARLDAKADIVRTLESGQAATAEFRSDRLNLIMDRKGVVIRASCG